MDNMQVDHKDNNKHNNVVSNLEWVSPSENVRRFSSVTSRRVLTRRVVCVETGTTFESMRGAAKAMKVSVSGICMVCKGIRPKASGYTWKYAD